KVVSWNVASLNASFKKGLMRYLTAEMADIVCLQETKLRADPAPDSDLGTALGAHWPHQAWSHSAKPGYSGTAILSRTAPLAVETGLGSHAAETEGRVVACRFPDFVLVNVYVPNASEGLKRTGFKQAFLVALRAHVADLVQRWDPVGQRLLLVGDVNTCLYPTDLARPKTNIKTSGFSPDERRDYHDFLMGYPDAPSSESADRRSFEPLVDLYRRQHGPQAGGYTYYSYRFQARAKGLGWRLDAFLASRALADTLFKTIAVREDAYGASDHVPLIALLERTDPA
ncbi:exodeoxyribonuclease III xth, partial [Caulochytrium protostelioides]